MYICVCVCVYLLRLQEELRASVFRAKATFEQLLTPNEEPPDKRHPEMLYDLPEELLMRGRKLLKAVYEMNYDKPSAVQAFTLPAMMKGCVVFFCISWLVGMQSSCACDTCVSQKICDIRNVKS